MSVDRSEAADLAARRAGAAGGDAGDRAGIDRVRCSRIQHIYNDNPEGLYYVLLLSRSYTNDRAGHEISGREAVSRYCWPQDECQSRRGVLEVTERDRQAPRHDLVGVARRNRFRATPRKSIVGHSLIRPQLLSRSSRYSGKKRGTTRGDRPICPRIQLKTLP